MISHSIPVFSNGMYRIVCVTVDGDDHGRIAGYAVLDSAGIRLRHELTLDDAKAWMQRFIDEDNVPLSAGPMPTKTRQVRR